MRMSQVYDAEELSLAPVAIDTLSQRSKSKVKSG
jgi:hypothetical protein